MTDKCEGCLNRHECKPEDGFLVGDVVVIRNCLFKIKNVKSGELRLKLIKWR